MKLGKFLFMFFLLLVISLSAAGNEFVEKTSHQEPEKAVPKIDPKIMQEESDVVSVIVETEKDDYNFLEQVEEAKKLGPGGFYSMKLRKDKIKQLEENPNVASVQMEREYHALLDVAVPLINASIFWNVGYNGSGIKVCVLDTGINNHTALASRIIAQADFTNSTSGTNDTYGHGTHVAGIVASTNQTYSGVAPGVLLLNAKVLNDNGTGFDIWIISGIVWCVSNGADILTMSLGGLAIPADGSDVLSRYIDMIADQGKVITIAAGNSGSGIGGETRCRTIDPTGSSYSICSPGLSRKAITVGSTQSGKSSTVDSISGFSSRGPTADGRIKPDVTAPGEWITSTWKSGGFNTIAGTSMSTPMVAGLAALILQARNMTPEEVKVLAMNTAIEPAGDVIPGKDKIYGAGRVNGSTIFDEINNTARAVIDASGYRAHNIFVPAGSSGIRATLYWPENHTVHNDLDLYLLDPAGNVRNSSLSIPNTDEMMRFSNPTPAGNWKLLVNPAVVNGSQVYAIASNFKPSEQMYFITNNISDVLFYQINVTDNKKLTVNLDWNLTNNNLDLYLYNTSGDIVNYSANENTNSESVSVNNTESGSWTVKIVPVNLTGRIRFSLTSQFRITELPRNITFASPTDANNSYVNRNYTFINVSVTGLNINSCTLEWNGSNYTMSKSSNGNDYCFLNRTDSDGVYVYKVHANDTLNSIVSETRTITFDTIMPEITGYRPQSGYRVKGSEENFSVNYTEMNLEEISLFLKNETENYIKTALSNCLSGINVSCSIIVNLSQFHEDSNLTFLFRITDKTNKSLSTAETNLTIDRFIPNVTIQSPANTTYSITSIPLNFTVLYNGTISECKYELNGINNTLTGNMTINVSEGNSKLRIYCKDKLNNTASAGVNFTVKIFSTAFIVFSGAADNVFSPNNDGIYDEITLNITASELVNFSTTYILLQNGSRIKFFQRENDTLSIQKPWNGRCSYSLSYCNTTVPAPDGVYKIEIRMTDMLGNVNATNLSETIILDTKPIEVSFAEPTPNNSTLDTTNSVLINVTTSEAPYNITLEWNGANETMFRNATNWFITKANLDDGNYTFKVYVNDSAGNRNATEKRYVFINVGRNLSAFFDNITGSHVSKNISVAIINSSEEIQDPGRLSIFSNYTLRFNASNLTVDIENFLITNLNQSAFVNVTSNLSGEGSGSPESIVIAAFSQAGASLDRYVWVDNGLLSEGNYTAKITFPRSYGFFFYLNGTRNSITTEKINNTCDADLSNKPCINNSSIYLPSFSGAAAGNDTQPPSLNVISPTSTTFNSSSIPLTYTVSDNIAVDECWFSLNNGPNITLTDCQNATITAAQGSNTLDLYANDMSNNVNRTTITFTFSQPVQAQSPPPPGGTDGGGEAEGDAPSAQRQNTTIKAQQTQQTQTNEINAANNVVENVAEVPEETASKENNGTEKDESPTGLAIASPNIFNLVNTVVFVTALSGLLIWIKLGSIPKARKTNAKKVYRWKPKPAKKPKKKSYKKYRIKRK